MGPAMPAGANAGPQSHPKSLEGLRTKLKLGSMPGAYKADMIDLGVKGLARKCRGQATAI